MILILTALMLGVMWFFLIRPQREQARKHAELVAGLEVGDDVLTSAGIYGSVVGIDDDDLEVEIADGVVVTMTRSAVIEVAVDEVDEDDEVTDESDADVDGPIS